MYERHGRYGTSEYNSWASMRARCLNPKHNRYPSHGGRGITICSRWLNSFSNFYADMGKKPTPEHTLERLDNEGHYDPYNCCWATPIDQARNRRSSLKLEFRGVSKPAKTWAEELGIPYYTLFHRIHALGWTVEKALTKPRLFSSSPRVLTLNGVSNSISGWSRITGLDRGTISSRLTRGLPVEEVLKVTRAL